MASEDMTTFIGRCRIMVSIDKQIEQLQGNREFLVKKNKDLIATMSDEERSMLSKKTLYEMSEMQIG